MPPPGANTSIKNQPPGREGYAESVALSDRALTLMAGPTYGDEIARAAVLAQLSQAAATRALVEVTEAYAR